MLRSRRDAARRRLAAARHETAQAEEDLRKWEAALAIEERGNGAKPLSPTKSPMARPLLTPNARMKHELFRNALIEAGRPLTSAELMARLKPILSERYIYYLRATLKKAGELEEHDGKLSLREKEEDAVQEN